MQAAGAWHIAMLEPRASQLFKDEHGVWESRTGRILAVRGYDSHYPSIPRRTHIGHRRTRMIAEPMFRSYIFVRQAAAKGWEALRETPGVAYLLRDRATERAATISEDMFWAIVETENRLRDEILNPKPKKLPFGVGDRVQVTEGPFKDLFAKIATLDSDARIAILLEITGWRVTAKADQLKPAKRLAS